MANVLRAEARLRILAALVDGCSIRAAERIVGVHRDTVMRFGLRLGDGCERLHNAIVHNLVCAHVELDEQWGFVRKKQRHLTPKDNAVEDGDAWTWTAIDRTSRLAIAFRVAKRDDASAYAFVCDLRARLVTMPQFTTDGLAAYIPAIASAFGSTAILAQTVKRHCATKRGKPHPLFFTKRVALGEPDLKEATTSHNERVNLTMRHVNGRLRRKCLSFSKRLANHRAAVALSYTHYNFCRVVRTLKTTPAVRAGLTDHVWTLDEFMDAVLSAPPCGPPEVQPLRAIERPPTTGACEPR